MHVPLALIEGIGGPELLLIMFIVLLLFGANRLPELARGIGKSMREFKKAASGVEEEVRRAMEEDPVKPLPLPKPTALPPPPAEETKPAAEEKPPPPKPEPGYEV